jgi:hypothetical protein
MALAREAVAAIKATHGKTYVAGTGANILCKNSYNIAQIAEAHKTPNGNACALFLEKIYVVAQCTTSDNILGRAGGKARCASLNSCT